MGVQQNVSKGGRNGQTRGKAGKSGGNDVMRTGKNAMRDLEATGERDESYNLISVLYHALQGAETYTQYIADAEASGDEDLVEFFTECREEEKERAQRAKMLLGARIGGVALGEQGFATDSEDEEE